MKPQPSPLPMASRTVLVTGATGGIGKATALGLAALGAHVAIVGRSRERTERAAADIRAATGGRVTTLIADLSAQSEVHRLAAQALARLPRIDVLINNAGGYWNTRRTTVDGLEHTFALNHLAPFLLTNLLLGRMALSRSARVVTVASNAQSLGRIDFDDLQGAASYSGARAYNQSKLANVLFTYEPARRLGAHATVGAHAVHPGLVSTGFGAEDPAPLQRWLVPLLRPFMSGPARGAATSVHVAAAPELTGTTGQYFVSRKARRSSPISYDETVAARLWEVSAHLVGLPAETPSPPVTAAPPARR